MRIGIIYAIRWKLAANCELFHLMVTSLYSMEPCVQMRCSLAVLSAVYYRVNIEIFSISQAGFGKVWINIGMRIVQCSVFVGKIIVVLVLSFSVTFCSWSVRIILNTFLGTFHFT